MARWRIGALKRPSIHMGRHGKAYSTALVICLLLMAAGYAPAQTWHTVKWVEDGDTIILKTGEWIRYLGINAPEIAHADSKAQPYGYQARAFNKKLLRGSKIRLEFDIERYDQYGRMLAYVFLPDGSFVNSRLLENGLAFYLYRMPNVKHAKILYPAQLAAMQSKKGLWYNWNESSGKYVGNSKSRRFHRVGCPYAAKIKAANRVDFSSRWDAFQAGYAPAKECIIQFWSYKNNDE